MYITEVCIPILIRHLVSINSIHRIGSITTLRMTEILILFWIPLRCSSHQLFRWDDVREEHQQNITAAKIFREKYDHEEGHATKQRCSHKAVDQALQSGIYPLAKYWPIILVGEQNEPVASDPMDDQDNHPAKRLLAPPDPNLNTLLVWSQHLHDRILLEQSDQ